MKDFMNIKEIQSEETVMLEIITKYLEKNKIKHSIYYGTLLGAIRHKGFIPWDDDIDLGVLRKDYEKLLECLKRDRFIVDEENELEAIGFELGNSDWPFIKIVNKKIKIFDNATFDNNLWIDIFPLDNIPNDNKKYIGRLSRYRDIYFVKRDQIKGVAPVDLKNKIKRCLYSVIAYDKFLQKYIDFCKRYADNDTKYAGKMVWGRVNVFEKDKFEVEKRKFENINAYCVQKYDYFLTLLYGDDYMQLPPEEKRVTHMFKAKKVK